MTFRNLFAVCLLASAPLRGQAGKAPVELAVKDAVINSRSGLSSIPLAASAKVSVSLATVEIRSQEGFQVSAKAISFPGTPVNIVPGSPVEVNVLADPGLINASGTYQITAKAVGHDAAGKSFSAPITFKYMVTGFTLRIEDGQPLRTTLTRSWPFGSITQRVYFPLHPTPGDSRISGLTVSNGGLKKKNGEYPAGASIRDGVVMENDHSVELTLNVPADTNELAGTIRISGQALKQDVESALIVNVKDFWVFPFLVVGIGYTLSYLTTRWATSRRQQLLNEFQRDRILQAVEDLLAAQTTKQRSDFNGVFDLIEKSKQLGSIGNTDAERDTLQQADAALDQMRVAMQAAPAGVEPASFSVRRLPEKTGAGILAKIKIGDNWINAMGIVMVVLIAFSAIWQKDSFSGLTDYVMAILGAFGIDQSVKGVAPILSRLRNGS